MIIKPAGRKVFTRDLFVVANLLVEAHCTCENASKSEYYFLSEESYTSHVNQLSEVLDSKSKQHVGNSAECLQMSSTTVLAVGVYTQLTVLCTVAMSTSHTCNTCICTCNCSLTSCVCTSVQVAVWYTGTGLVSISEVNSVEPSQCRNS